MNYSHLYSMRNNCAKILADSLLEFVRINGTDCTEEDINKFELPSSATKIYNFYDESGCWFFESDYVNCKSLDDMNESNFKNKLFEAATTTAYLCIYIEKNKLGFYRFYNGGVSFDEENAECDHGYVDELPLNDIERIINAINVNETRKTRKKMWM